MTVTLPDFVGFDPIVLKGDRGDSGEKGDTGAAGATPNVTIGTITALPAGSAASASITGTPSNPVLNLQIPQGADGTPVVSGAINGAGAMVLTLGDGTTATVPGVVAAVTTATNSLYPPTARTVTAGTGLTGGGDLSADRTLTVAYGTTAATAAQGNDSRITGAAQTTGATFTGAVRFKGGPYHDVMAYGAVGDGSTDDTTAITSAFTAAGTNGKVFFPGGKTFAVTALPTPSTGMTLSGFGATVKRSSGVSRLLNINAVAGVTVEGLTLDGNNTAGDVVFVGNAVTTNTILRGLAIKNAGTSAAGIQVNAASRCHISDIDVSNCYWGVLLANACSDITMNSFTIRAGLTTSASEGALYLANTSNVRMSLGFVTANAGHGVYVPSTGTNLTFVGVHSNSNGTTGSDHRGFSLNGCSSIRFIGCHAEANIECGYYVGSSATDITFDGCTSKGNNIGLRAGGHGFELDGQRIAMTGCQATGQLGNATGAGSGFANGGQDITFTGCVSSLNFSHGFRCASGSNGLYSGCIAKNNSQSNAGVASGFQLDVSATEITLMCCRAYDDQGTKTQGWGLTVTGSVNNYTYVGCNFRGNLTANVADTGLTNHVIANNIT